MVAALLEKSVGAQGLCAEASVHVAEILMTHLYGVLEMNEYQAGLCLIEFLDASLDNTSMSSILPKCHVRGINLDATLAA